MLHTINRERERLPVFIENLREHLLNSSSKDGPNRSITIKLKSSLVPKC